MTLRLLLLASCVILAVRANGVKEVGEGPTVCTIDTTKEGKFYKNYEEGTIKGTCKTYHYSETSHLTDRNPDATEELPPLTDPMRLVKKMGYVLIMQVPGMDHGRVELKFGGGETSFLGQHGVQVHFSTTDRHQGYHYLVMICWGD